MRAQQVTDPYAEHGEGPTWSDTWGGLRWVDMLAGDILTLDDATGSVSRAHVGKVAAVIRPRTGGGAVVALEHDLAITDGDLHNLKRLATVINDPRIRFNEGGCDPDGRFYCGSVAYDESPGKGAFYRCDSDGIVSVIMRAVTISNGFGFSPDGSRAYYIDSMTHRIDIFDYALKSGLTNRRPWVEIDVDVGIPDGLVVDSEGGVWVAMFGGSAVRRYTVQGRLDDVVQLHVSQVTACAFGGDKLDELYITTSKEGIDAASQTAAGALFKANVGVSGMPVLPFSG